ncbi:MAG TPA: glycosyltransferase family 39 protein, partial [Pirellulales bacterium]|nr:glycosyltransferase family 39 protein [Pirellulales bacterium]
MVAAAVGLRSWRLGERSLWFEAFSWQLSRFGWVEMLHRAGRDNNPPLYYAALKVWTSLFGDSPAALRSLSVASGAAACLAMYALMVEAFGHGPLAGAERARRLGDARWVGVCTAAFVATGVLQVRWGWEARMYALGTTLAACSGWLLLRALNRGDTRSWLVYAASAVAFAYTHTYALFSLAAQGAFAGGYLIYLRKDRRDPAVAALRRRAVFAGMLILAGWLPWVPLLRSQHAHVISHPGWPIEEWSVPVTCFEMFVDPELPVMGPYDGRIALAACGLVLLALLWRPAA